MRKLLQILAVLSILLIGCDESSSTTTTYWLSVSADKTEGTTEEAFTFTAETNDSDVYWYVDGSLYGSGTSYEMYFDYGDHTIYVESSNGAYDEIYVSVTEAEEETEESEVVEEAAEEEEYLLFTVTFLEKVSSRTELTYSGGILNYGLLTFDLWDMTAEDDTYSTVVAYDTDYGREICVTVATQWYVICEYSDDDIADMTEDEFTAFSTNIYEIEEPEADYTSIVYDLSATLTGDDSDTIDDVGDYSITISGESEYYTDMTYSITDEVRTVSVHIYADVKDFFFFHSDNLYNWFELDSDCLTVEELEYVGYVMENYPDTSVYELAYDYGTYEYEEDD